MTLHIYIGFDAIDHLAYRVCEKSILDNTRADVQIHPLRDWQLRGEGFYTRPYLMNPNGQKQDLITGALHSTEFSFTRFLTPIIHRAKRREGPCLFIDADQMFLGDVAELFALADRDFDVQVVKHVHNPKEETKTVGVVQQQYMRKNWSSVMLFPNAETAQLTLEDVNYRGRGYLHGFEWVNPSRIGPLPEEWNWLEGWSKSSIAPKNVHFTRGTPDLPGYEDVAYAETYMKIAKDAGWLGHNEL